MRFAEMENTTHSRIIHEDFLNLPDFWHRVPSLTYSHYLRLQTSLSSKHSLTTRILKNRTVNKFLDIFNQIGARNNLELRWIAAHSGLWGNEKADELAKHGTTSTTTIARPIPQSHINKLINDTVDKLNTDIVTKDCLRHTKMILGPNHTKIINNLNHTKIIKQGALLWLCPAARSFI